MSTSPSVAASVETLSSLARSRDFLDTIATGIVIFDAGGVVVDANQAAARLCDRSLDEVKRYASRTTSIDVVGHDGVALGINQFPSQVVLRTGQPHLGTIVGVDAPDGARRWLWVDGYPLIIDDEIRGVAVWFDDVSPMRQEHRSLQLLNEVNRFVMSSRTDADPLQKVCDALVTFGSYALAWIGFASPDEPGTVNVACAAGVTEYLYDGMVSSRETEDRGRGPVGTALGSRTTQVVAQVRTDTRLGPWRHRAATFDLESSVTIPFAPGGRDAVLCVYANAPFAFDPVSVKGLEAIAHEIEFAISQARNTMRLEEALDGTLYSLGAMTETRDPYTAGHQNRVGVLGAAMATHLGLDAKMAALVRRSGEVHDIGKIAVPAEILTRPGRLSHLEFEMIKGHTTVGFAILSKASLPWPIAEVAYSHHERLDGSGYPLGLADADIIVPARIIAVADVVESMDHYRPYRAALGLDAALAEVVRGAGTLFDRDVVESCLAVFAAGFDFDAIAPAGVVTMT